MLIRNLVAKIRIVFVISFKVQPNNQMGTICSADGQSNVSLAAPGFNEQRKGKGSRKINKLVRANTIETFTFEQELKLLKPSERLTARIQKNYELAKLKREDALAQLPTVKDMGPEKIVVPSH